MTYLRDVSVLRSVVECDVHHRSEVIEVSPARHRIEPIEDKIQVLMIVTRTQVIDYWSSIFDISARVVTIDLNSLKK